MKKYVVICISIVIAFTWNCFPVSSEYSNDYILSDNYYHDVNYDAEFDESSVLVLMRQNSGAVSLFSTRLSSAGMTFAGLGIAEIENLDVHSDGDISLFSADEESIALKLTLKEPGRENVIETIEKLKEIPEVECAEPNYIYSLSSLPNDTHYVAGNQYGLDKISAPAVWAMDINCSDMAVAVIDSGTMPTHPDLVNNIWTNPGEIPDNGIDDDGNGYIDDVQGWDFYSNDNDATDENGHGTHVSGIISAMTNNKIGVASLARNAKIVPLKVFGSGKDTSNDYVYKALKYIDSMGFTVANNSFGGFGYSEIIFNAIKSCKNTVFVTASGNAASGSLPNNNDAKPIYPASYQSDNIIAVAATDKNDNLSTFSNYGANSVDVAAPGTSIYSTMWNSGTPTYSSLNGTSMACPMVTSAAAIMRKRYPDMTPAEIIAQIESSADVVGGLTGKVKTSARLNAYEALMVHAIRIELNKSYLELKKGETSALTANVHPMNNVDSVVSWQSSDESIAVVDNGTVTAKEGGTAIITASCGEVSAECTITVIAPTPTPSPTPTPTSEPVDRIDFKQSEGKVLAKLVFEKTIPPKEEDINLYVAYKKNGIISHIEVTNVIEMETIFIVPEKYADCEISVYVWDKDMKPLMAVQNLEQNAKYKEADA